MSQPAGFAERYHTISNTEVDVRCEQIHKNNLGKRLTCSNKYKSAALRLVYKSSDDIHSLTFPHTTDGFAWTIIPGTGLATLVTELFAARISEVELVKVHRQAMVDNIPKRH